MDPVEESDREHQRPRVAVALELVMHPHRNTLRGASNAPTASPTPTSARAASRTKTCLQPDAARQRHEPPRAKVGGAAAVEHDRRKRNHALGRDQRRPPDSPRSLRASGSRRGRTAPTLRAAAPPCAPERRSHRPRSSHSVRTYVPSLQATRMRTRVAVEPQHAQVVDRDLARLALDVHALARQLVQPPPLVVHRTVHRRHLFDDAREPRRAASQQRARRRPARRPSRSSRRSRRRSPSRARARA